MRPHSAAIKEDVAVYIADARALRRLTDRRSASTDGVDSVDHVIAAAADAAAAAAAATGAGDSHASTGADESDETSARVARKTPREGITKNDDEEISELALMYARQVRDRGVLFAHMDTDFSGLIEQDELDHVMELLQEVSALAFAFPVSALVVTR